MQPKPTLADLKNFRPACPLCGRPNFRPSDHHLVPKCRGGDETVTLCRDCHSACHAIFSNKELESTYNSVESLMGHETFAATIGFISKQDPGGRVTTKLTAKQRRRGRNA